MHVTKENLRFVPRKVRWDEVKELHRFDDRFGLINSIEGAIMDVTEDHVELTLDDAKPSMRQLVAWAWLIRPDLDEQLTAFAPEPLLDAMRDYRENPPRRVSES